MNGQDRELIYLTIDMWHPDCWTLHVTEGADAGLLGYEMTLGKGQYRLYRAYSGDHDELEKLLSAIEDSEFTNELLILSPSTSADSSAYGLVTQDILVDFPPAPSIRDAFASRGFMHYGPSQHEDGRERRSLLALTNRETVDTTLDELRDLYDADFDIQQLTSSTPPSGMTSLPEDGLSPRQREVFQLAQSRGYYEYPRKVTAQELADGMDITKSTLLEHLRKAEQKLITGIEFH